MRVTNEKNCYCYACHREFHYMGIARHRAMHRDKKEDCTITYTDGDVYDYRFSEIKRRREK